MLSTTDVKPDCYTFPPVLKVYSKLGLEWDVFVAASLVHMYCRFQCLCVALRIFKDMPYRDIGCWNVMISGFHQNGNAMEALSLLDEMRLKGIKMNLVTTATLLLICAPLGDTVRTRNIAMTVECFRQVLGSIFVKICGGDEEVEELVEAVGGLPDCLVILIEALVRCRSDLRASVVNGALYWMRLDLKEKRNHRPNSCGDNGIIVFRMHNEQFSAKPL
ncbi:pentatricopeptide repeat-containing protein like [Capsicum annuum]|uniref:pentatricopeptide repeat-containing protein At4g33990-like n=1 Tax=Capsicum annuum TaxID=4072 RepID=UPI001FB122A4|nr:pentatricopeptide repeat-containing protein At4g33990-like [Capsicum annuum]